MFEANLVYSEFQDNQATQTSVLKQIVKKNQVVLEQGKRLARGRNKDGLVLPTLAALVRCGGDYLVAGQLGTHETLSFKIENKQNSVYSSAEGGSKG